MIKDIYSQLRRDEGEVKKNGRHVAYKDHLGYLTIGIGRLIDEARGGGLDDIEARILLEHDVSNRSQQLSDILPWFSRLDEARQGALINMAFQLGVKGLLNFRKTLSLIEQGNYAEASKEARRSTWAIQTPDRARRVSRQIKSGHWV